MIIKALSADRTISWVVASFAILAIVGLMVPNWVLNGTMFGLARGLAVLGLLVLWRTGLVSFGHALYFGLGAYAVALLEKYTGVSDVFVRLAVALATAAAVGFMLGFVLRNHRGIFFAMLSLAFSMVLYGVLIKSEALGSTDGFSVSQTTILGWQPETKYPLFLTIILTGVVAAVGMQIYFRSALGHLTTAVRDNEIRVEYLGYSVAQAIHIKYVLSAALTGAAGGLFAMALGQVDPDSMVNWTVSGELVFISILSGPGSVAAPFIGAVAFEFLRTFAFELAPHAWQLIVGGTLLGIILFLPRGLWSLIERLPMRQERDRE
ncbi:MAG: branched-chain amino acid ABC transporter permease [Aestuariivita sp.]|nr:branched-chain amino acid ABC transporter permease [Aestuariivita sp.]MCY4203404.1 branched-chain amino acid ABC transporter permease [Aestuariivita sp.]MCY4288332.1 branched-chain amino acid ABC transporter permease [Aestuariivita sp.]MCY4345658.1 branched-chain amino acid ABC transporter permease [Aestuariivita sp.]